MKKPHWWRIKAIEPVSDIMGRGDYCSGRFYTRQAAMDHFNHLAYGKGRPWTTRARVVIYSDDDYRTIEHLLLPALEVAC